MQTKSLFPILAILSCAIYSFTDKENDWYLYLYISLCTVFVCLFLYKIIALYVKERKLDHFAILGIIASIVITDLSLILK